MNYKTYQEEIKGKGQFYAFEVCPYFHYEKWSARTFIVSDQVESITVITHYRKAIATILPKQGTVEETIEKHFAILQTIVGVLAPCLTIFEQGKKVKTINEPLFAIKKSAGVVG